MKECSKSIPRRLSQPNFSNRYFVGEGLDIGGKPDPLALYREVFSRIASVRTWDIEDGDAQFLAGVPDASYDFVHSSHCLEHLHNPGEGLANWLRVIRPGGHVIVTVPDEDLYEQGRFPSTFNVDHKWTFTIHKPHSWSGKSINVLTLVSRLGPEAPARASRTARRDDPYQAPALHQTVTPIGEAASRWSSGSDRLSEFASRRTAARRDARCQKSCGSPESVRNDIETMKYAEHRTRPFDEPGKLS